MDLTKRLRVETSEFYLFDKPAGFGVHKDESKQGLITSLSEQLGEPLWLVHRLDKMTSGALILARNKESAAELSAAFKNRQVDKLYIALSDRKPKRKQGKVVGDLGRARGGSWRLLRDLSNPAMTEFKSESVRTGLRLFLCHPITGKTHQIRVALKTEGSPILGDTRYAGRSKTDVDRGYLHSWQIGFVLQGRLHRYRVDPTEGKLFTDKDVQANISALENPAAWPSHWHLPILRSLQEIGEVE